MGRIEVIGGSLEKASGVVVVDVTFDTDLNPLGVFGNPVYILKRMIGINWLRNLKNELMEC